MQEKSLHGFEIGDLYCICFKVTSLPVSKTLSHAFSVILLYLEYMSIS